MLTRRARKGTIPVVLLTGFLGAGKTTILNHILRTAVGARIAVIVNDFGAVNIDSLLIQTETDRKIELTNGCVCCAMEGGELEESIKMVLASNPDVIIIEASGLSEPEDIARLVLLSPNGRISYGGSVYAVDAVNYETTVRKHARLTTSIMLADLVVLTKTEHITSHEIQGLLLEFSKHTKSPAVPVRNGELSPELLFDIPQKKVVQPLLLQAEKLTDDRHLHDSYQSLIFESSKPLDWEKFKSFMDKGSNEIYRIKGFVYFGVAGYEQKYIVQSVGGRWDMYMDEWQEDETPLSCIVLIGTEFDRNKVLSQLEKAIGESNHMIDVQRYREN